MDLGLTEFLKLSPLQATFAIVFGRLRVPARYEAPPEIADRIEPRIATGDEPSDERSANAWSADGRAADDRSADARPAVARPALTRSVVEPRMTAIADRDERPQPYIGRTIEQKRSTVTLSRQPQVVVTGVPKKARMFSA